MVTQAECTFVAFDSPPSGRQRLRCINEGCGRIVKLPASGRTPRANCPLPTVNAELQASGVANAVRKNRPATATTGPGTELASLIKQLGGRESAGCGCADVVSRMNRWGVDGCKANRAAIVAQLSAAAAKWGMGDWLAGGWKAVTSGALAWIDPLDPLGSMVDEAIKRAG